MKFMDHYDWVVIGDHPGALLSASLAARLGLSALVLPVREKQSGDFPAMTTMAGVSSTGQVFDPEPNFVIGMRNLVRSQGLLAHCLKKSGIQPLEEQLIVRDSFPQVITRDHRVSFLLDDEGLQLEFLRELGKDKAQEFGLVDALKETESEVLRHWLELPDRFTWVEEENSKKAKKKKEHPTLETLMRGVSKRSKLPSRVRARWYQEGTLLDGVARDLKNRDLAQVLDGLWSILASGESESKVQDLNFALQLLVLGRTGASFKGGLTAYREFLLRLAKRNGAHVADQIRCRRLFLESGRVVGVQASSHGNMIGMGAGVLGCSVKEARELLSESGAKAQRKLRSGLVPSGWRFSVALTVNSEAIPPGMAARSVWQEKDAPSLEIEVTDPSHYGQRDPESKVIFLRTILPLTDQTLQPTYQRLIATRMLRQLMEVMPFLEFHVVKIFPDFRNVESSRVAGAPVSSSVEDSLSELYSFKDVSEIPTPLLCYRGEGLGTRSGIDGLFLVNGESFPHLGSFGGTVAAVEAVAWLAHRSGLRGPLV